MLLMLELSKVIPQKQEKEGEMTKTIAVMALGAACMAGEQVEFLGQDATATAHGIAIGTEAKGVWVDAEKYAEMVALKRESELRLKLETQYREGVRKKEKDELVLTGVVVFFASVAISMMAMKGKS